MPSVVQFIHPGAEPPQKHVKPQGRRVEWHTHQTSVRHWRKFLLGKEATYLPENGTIIQGQDITFWGEWEPDSETHTIYGGHPYSLQAPCGDYKRPKDKGVWPHTTDPFVFGERFYFTHCRQNSHLSLRNLEPGSLILFGFQSAQSGKYAFYLDTVMVVAKRTNAMEFRQSKNHVKNQDLYRTNLGLLDERVDRNVPFYILYEGRVYEEDLTFYSYVPCKPYSNGSENFPKPDILSEKIVGEFSRFFWKQCTQRCKITPGEPEEIQALWNAVLKEVYAAGLYPGWGMRLPGGKHAESEFETLNPQPRRAC